MKNGIKINCNNCGNSFDSYKIKINKFRRPDGLTELFYLCQKCKKRYVVCLHSDETLQMQKKINKLDRMGHVDGARSIRLVLKRKLDELNKREER